MEVPFVDLPDKTASAEEIKRAKLEPFGFVDGVSQPAIRGTYKALRGADPIHIVEAGEFILGYPDNRGNLPAGPTLDAIHDPDNVLPIATASQHGFARPIVNDDRDLGRNGTFLVDPPARTGRRQRSGSSARTPPSRLHEQFPHWGGVQAGVRRRQTGRPLAGRLVSSCASRISRAAKSIASSRSFVWARDPSIRSRPLSCQAQALPPQPPAQPQAVATSPSHRKVSVTFTRDRVRDDRREA